MAWLETSWRCGGPHFLRNNILDFSFVIPAQAGIHGVVQEAALYGFPLSRE